MTAPIRLVSVDRSIKSSYNAAGKTSGPRSELRALADTSIGIAVPEVAAALLELNEAVTEAGGDLRITELHRSIATQRNARAKYECWIRAGRPSPGSSSYNSATMKSSFVAMPGASNHNAGRAIDIHVGMLKFPNVSASAQLDRFWEIAAPIGWSPVIRTPDERASECWHFDFWGDLRGVYKRLKYSEAARVGAILVGHGDTDTYVAQLQALLQRAGYNIGPVDGIAGAKTKAALKAAINTNDASVTAILQGEDRSIWPALLALPPA